MFGNNKRRRTNLDAALMIEENQLPSTGSISDPPEETMKPPSMATQITSYNPCKDDPYGASSMPIYQVKYFINFDNLKK